MEEGKEERGRGWWSPSVAFVGVVLGACLGALWGPWETSLGASLGDLFGRPLEAFFQVGRLPSNLKPIQLGISLDSKVFALKSKVFALLGAKALDFGAKTFGNPLEFRSQIQGFCIEIQGFCAFGRKGLGFRCKSLGFLRFSLKPSGISSWIGFKFDRSRPT